MGNETNGRLRTILTDDEHHAFDERFAIVFFRDQGIAKVIDEATEQFLTFTRFKNEHGVRGALWLTSDRARVFHTVQAYATDKARREARRPIDVSATPQKNNYHRSTETSR